jgi:uncharacterized protein YbjT (DUF2867 family)
MTILILGASGLIGNSIAIDLIRRGIPIIAAARRFYHSQRVQFATAAREIPIAELDSSALTRLVVESAADVVVNCLGLLQDVPGECASDIHEHFVKRLLAALRDVGRPVLLVHLSIPGVAADDRTTFASSKRDAERAIAEAGMPYAILRPGFVFAPAAYGGSAMMRALAVLPFALPARLAARPFAVAAVEDIAETVSVVAQRWGQGHKGHAVAWDLMHPDQHSIGEALASLRTWFGTGPARRLAVPMVLLKLGTLVGDFTAWLGWRPPLRSTALAELLRGVAGDPRPWMAATDIAPRSLDDLLHARPASVQEKWFARLYLMKALIIVTLVLFWCASALIALTVAYPAAVAILTAHGYSLAPAQTMTIVGSTMDFSIGLAIAFRQTNRWGLMAGIALALFYMLAAAILTPEQWIEPLGALVKTFPAIVLMLVALGIADER